MRIAKVGADWVVKGVHVHVGNIELMVRPGHAGTIVLKPVFSSAPRQAVAAAIRHVQQRLADVYFRRQLHRAARRGLEYLRQCGLPGAAAKSGEVRFQVIAFEKLGVT